MHNSSSDNRSQGQNQGQPQGNRPMNQGQGQRPPVGQGYQGNNQGQANNQGQGQRPAFNRRPWEKRGDRPPEKGKHRLNHMIRVPNVRVVQDGKQLGIMPTSQALTLALDQGLDLVEIAPQGNPPVCSIMDYGQFKYQEKIKEKEQARKQRESSQQMKEIRLSPSIGDHDLQVKVKQAKDFIEDGKRVQIVVTFHRRQLAHKELGFEVVKKFVAQLGDSVTVESPAKMEGNRLNCRVAPK